MFNVDKENINLSKNKIVKNKSLKINTNKKNKINGHDDVLDDNNSIASIIKKVKRNNMLKSDSNKEKDIVYDETNNDDELMKRELFLYIFF